MPSRSQAQQKFMAMVHADKKGELKHASPEVQKAANSMSDKSAKDFASTSRKGLPMHAEEESVHKVLEAIARYNEYKNLLQRETSLSQIAEDLSELAETAESAIMEEGEGKYDSYDSYTIKRNLQEFSKYVSEFAKFAKEADTLEQRISALHSDMGRILERYFDTGNTNEIANGLPTTSADTSSGQPDDSAEFSVRGSMVKGSMQNEAENIQEKGRNIVSHPANHAIPPIKKTLIPSENHKMSHVDELTIRAIKSLYERLKKESPEAAAKFRKLHPKKMVESIWKLVK